MNKLFYGDNPDVLRKHIAEGSVGGNETDISHIHLAFLKREDGTKGKQADLL